MLAQVDAIEPAAVRDSAAARRCRFHRHGDAWELEYAGKRATVSHRVGMEYLRQLLTRPGDPVPVLELASARRRAVLVERAAGPVIDRRAFAEVQRRIAEIEAEVDTYEARGATPSDALRAELAECRGYLTSSGGGILSASDRARPSVTKAIDRAIAAIAAALPVLGHHLRRHVETGRTCVYVPDVAAPLRFDF